MSHKGTRKSQNAALTEDKEKRQTDSPVKEMKKKIAANAEKEKHTTEKPDKTVKSPERNDKNAEKPDKVPEKTPNEKPDSKKAQNADKVEKKSQTPDKSVQKAEKADKNVEKNDKNAEKPDNKADKVADKKADKPVEKKNEPEKKKEEVKADTNAKDTLKPATNGANGDANGDTVSEPDSEEDLLVIDDQDEVFPELTYDDTSDPDFEEGAPSRSFTRRSQSKEKLLKMNDSLATDRKLRSADSPKPESKKPEATKPQDSPKKDGTIDLTEEPKEKSVDTLGKNQLEMDVVIEVEGIEGETRSKTRARVSPFSSRLPPTAPAAPATAPRHDLTTTSMLANYTGNNTTMEMDISESSILSEGALDDSGYLRGLRAIRGRSSYKPLKELALKHTLNRSVRSAASANTSLTESGRPTGTVVGRKRKPDAEEPVEAAREAAEAGPADAADPTDELLFTHTKRMRLLDRFSVPFRGFATRRAAEIVGINTDLPLTAPVASTSSFDPETLKHSSSPSDPIAVPLPAPTHDRENKRCSIM